MPADEPQGTAPGEPLCATEARDAAAKFLEENASAIDYWNARMENEGLLLVEYRLF